MVMMLSEGEIRVMMIFWRETKKMRNELGLGVLRYNFFLFLYIKELEISIRKK